MATKQSIQKKYDEERDRRLASSTIGKYNNVRQPGLEDLSTDHFADYEALARGEQPLKDRGEIKVLFGGAGHSAIFFAYHLTDMSTIRQFPVNGLFGLTRDQSVQFKPNY